MFRLRMRPGVYPDFDSGSHLLVRIAQGFGGGVNACSLLDASAFGDMAEGFVRLGFVLDEDSLTQACRRIADFVAQLEPQAV